MRREHETTVQLKTLDNEFAAEVSAFLVNNINLYIFKSINRSHSKVYLLLHGQR